MPSISVIVPVYKVEEYLSKCIDSILSQTFTDYELILVNDGSPDQCLSICEAYAKKDERIRIVDKPNGGLSDARNAGMKIATGQYLSFIDSDDFIEPTMLEKCYAKLEDTGADMVCFDVYQYYMQTGQKEVIKNPFDESSVYALKTDPRLLTSLMNAAWNKVYKRSLFVDHGIEYPKGYYYEDLGTTYRLLARCEKVAFINEPLYDYLIDRPGNITLQFNRNTFHIFDMVEMIIEDYKQQGLYEKYYEEIKFLGSVNILTCLKKTRLFGLNDVTEEFIDQSFAFIKRHWPEFPKCTYDILREKNDWVYASPIKLKTYLRMKGLLRKEK